ncbi:HAD family hydrolase [Streptomyces sp. NPDC088757]|uniref:HAD family hydrolase n=1 Tax=Streptomyces sp. NPDC088757 TaxID=3365889 RepID=UPI00380DBD82
MERALTVAEVRAVALAGQPTPGAAEALRAARAAGRGVAVVSDNSTECVQAFLELHGLREHVTHIVGRPSEQPHLMKPNPFPLITAAEQTHIDVTSCTLIGDSLTDVRAAHAAGATAIGYANKPHKTQAFTEARADVVTQDMWSIADALTAASWPSPRPPSPERGGARTGCSTRTSQYRSGHHICTLDSALCRQAHHNNPLLLCSAEPSPACPRDGATRCSEVLQRSSLHPRR